MCSVWHRIQLFKCSYSCLFALVSFEKNKVSCQMMKNIYVSEKMKVDIPGRGERVSNDKEARVGDCAFLK